MPEGFYLEIALRKGESDVLRNEGGRVKLYLLNVYLNSEGAKIILRGQNYLCLGFVPFAVNRTIYKANMPTNTPKKNERVQ